MPATDSVDRVRFENAVAQAPFTAGSFPRVISPQYASRCPGFAIPEAIDTILEALQEARYDTACFVFNPALRPGRGYDRGFDRFEDFVTSASAPHLRRCEWVTAEQVRSEVRPRLGSTAIQIGAQPRF
jgi:arylsulfatase A-like enzyme